MRILIIGVKGFIGKKLAMALISAGHEVTGLSRNPSPDVQLHRDGILLANWDGKSPEILKDLLKDKEVIINLAGESIASGRWTKNRKKVMISSRAGIGRILSEVIMQLENKPSCLIQGSATGFYGRLSEGITDESAPQGKGFLAELTGQWEASVSVLPDAGVRIVYLRTGVVLGQDGGMLKKLLLPFRFYSGTTPGSGKHWISWIHMEDLVRAIIFLAGNPQSSGPYNLTSPFPVTIGEMVREIAKVTGKPAWMKIPDGILKLALGEMASETILSSQTIYPARLQNEGFSFIYPSIDKAMASLLSRSTK